VTARVVSDEEEARRPAQPRQRAPRRGGGTSTRSLAYSWSLVAALHRRRDLLLALVVAALPRLWQLGQTIFLDDQSALLALGRSALAHHALPATGIRSSIGTLNFPASIYLLLPFAALPDPFWAALATALANVAAVGLLFLLVKRYAGRRAALFAALLYASAPWAVYFSRFAWQQNLLAPVVVLFFWTACLGVVERRHGWLPWNLLLWAIAVQLHPSAAPLLLLTLVGVWLARHRLRRRDLLLGAAALVLPFLPTLLWELATSGSDAVAYTAFGSRSSALDGQVFATLLTLLTPPDPAHFDPSTPYANLLAFFGWTRVALVALYLAGGGWLLGALLRRRAELAGATDAAMPPARGQALRPPAGFLLLLALWQAAILLALIRHPKDIAEHYLLAMLPAVFLTMGLFLGWLAERLELASTLSREALHLAARRLPAIGLAALVAAQLLASGTFVASVAQALPDGRPAFAYLRYGIPLDAQQAALDATIAAARAAHARAYVATTAWGQPGFGYLAATGAAPRASVYDAGSCLIVPAAGSSPAVVLATEPLPSDAVLAALSGATSRPLRTGWTGPPLRLYTLPAGVHLPGETTLPAPATVGGDDVPHVTAYQYRAGVGGATSQLLLHWSGSPPVPALPATDLAYWRGALPGIGAVGSYTFVAQPVGTDGAPLGTSSVTATCAVLHWGAGEDVYTWMTLPNSTDAAGWHVSVERQLYALVSPPVGPLALESGDLALGPVERLSESTTVPAAHPVP